MPRHQLSEGAREEIEKKVDRMFDRLLSRFIGSSVLPSKIMGFEVISDPILSLPGMYVSATAEGGAPGVAMETFKSLARISANYINGVREQTKAKLIHAVDNAIARTGREDSNLVLQELEAQLETLWTKATAHLTKILETETSNARNEGIHEGITRMSASLGIQDPVVFKIVVKDEVLCETCKALWLMPDMITPRLYYMSELAHGYMTDHKHPHPTVGTTHPHCRCTMTFLNPGFGFDGAGKVHWVTEGHNEIENQRGSTG